MALSARNRLAGTVESVEKEGLMAEVAVEIEDGQTVTAVITADSAERLDLEEGAAVNAVVKATEVRAENR